MVKSIKYGSAKNRHGLDTSYLYERLLITTISWSIDWNGGTIFNKEKKNQCLHRNNFLWDFLTWLWHAKMMDAHSEIFQWADLLFSIRYSSFALFLVNQTLGSKSGPLGSVLGLTVILFFWHFIVLHLTLCGTPYCFLSNCEGLLPVQKYWKLTEGRSGLLIHSYCSGRMSPDLSPEKTLDKDCWMNKWIRKMNGRRITHECTSL